MGNRDKARMQSFEAGVAHAHHRERLRHHGGNALFVVSRHERSIGGIAPGYRCPKRAESYRQTSARLY